MRKLSEAEINHRYYATLTTAIAFLILTIQEGIKLLRLLFLNEKILLYEPILFLNFGTCNVRGIFIGPNVDA